MENKTLNSTVYLNKWNPEVGDPLTHKYKHQKCADLKQYWHVKSLLNLSKKNT